MKVAAIPGGKRYVLLPFLGLCFDGSLCGTLFFGLLLLQKQYCFLFGQYCFSFRQYAILFEQDMHFVSAMYLPDRKGNAGNACGAPAFP